MAKEEEKNAFSFYDYWLLNKYLIKTWTCLLWCFFSHLYYICIEWERGTLKMYLYLAAFRNFQTTFANFCHTNVCRCGLHFRTDLHPIWGPWFGLLAQKVPKILLIPNNVRYDAPKKMHNATYYLTWYKKRDKQGRELMQQQRVQQQFCTTELLAIYKGFK